MSIIRFKLLKENRICKCPKCWGLKDDGITCVPSSEKISLTCSSTGMNVTLDQCIFAGENEHVTLSFNDETCHSQSNNGTLSISSEGLRF